MIINTSSTLESLYVMAYHQWIPNKDLISQFLPYIGKKLSYISLHIFEWKCLYHLYTDIDSNPLQSKKIIAQILTTLPST